MSTPPHPENERERLAALECYGILDTPAEPVFDACVRLAAETCDAPIALVSLIDASWRWFEANVGLPSLSDGTRDDAFYARALASSEQVEIPGATLDPRFADDPSATGEPRVRFYAGMPLVDRDGFALGMLCVLDSRPRTLSAAQRSTLGRLADAIARLIEARARASREALEELALVTHALDASAEPMAILDLREDGSRTTIVFANRAFTALFEYAPTEIVGRAPATLFGARTDAAKMERLRSAATAGEAASDWSRSATAREMASIAS